MAVGSVSSTNNSQISALLQQKPESQEVQGRRERESNGNKDDGATAAKPAAPTVNTQGQTIGSVVNTTA